MLEVSTLQSPSKADQLRGVVGDHVGFPTSAADCDGFMVDDNLLNYIDFSCDVPFFDADGDILPDLEVDPTELLAEFQDSTVSRPADGFQGLNGDGGGAEAKPADVKEGHKELSSAEAKDDEKRLLLEKQKHAEKNGDEVLSAVTTEDYSAAAGSDTKSSASAAGHSKKKPSASAAKNSHGKRKVKVDWTPELHRRFVQAVEQLGIDKAVPSRILEIMGIQCLTRHNIASHLQKYRSHRKHVMAREAEAATRAQKRHMYAAAGTGGGRWVIGFPPPGVPPPLGRPLHVWGHPPTAVEAAAPPPPWLPVWPRHLPVDPAFWHPQYSPAMKWAPQTVTPGTPPAVPPAVMRFPAPPVPGMVPHPMYGPMIPAPPPPPPQSSKLAGLQPQLEAHPSKESIDAAIGDVLGKPWLPLPLGLKPPSLHSVMSELHKQGIPNVPPPRGC